LNGADVICSLADETIDGGYADDSLYGGVR